MTDRLKLAAELREQLANTANEDERERLRDDIAEYEGRTLTGDAHGREGTTG